MNISKNGIVYIEINKLSSQRKVKTETQFRDIRSKFDGLNYDFTTR